MSYSIYNFIIIHKPFGNVYISAKSLYMYRPILQNVVNTTCRM